MKLLLTSAGLSNKIISEQIPEMLGLDVASIKVAYIPTAAHMENGDKGWLIEDLWRFHEQKFAAVDIVDFAAVPQDVWLPRLEEANLQKAASMVPFPVYAVDDQSALKFVDGKIEFIGQGVSTFSKEG